MNVYRSFGNLLESWVVDGSRYSDAACLGNNDGDPATSSSDAGTSLRPESVDSGVETASPVTSFPPTPSSASTDNAEREACGLTPASTSRSPAPSSSSSSSSPLLGAAGATRVSVDEVLMRRPRASSGPTRRAPWVARGQRSRSFGAKRSANAPEPTTQTPQLRRRPMSAGCDLQAGQDLGERDRALLSPGLRYLEQVCQMLEEFARQQMGSRALQMETNALREDQNTEVDQAPATCQRDCKAAEEELSFCLKNNTKRAEHSEAQPGRNHPHSHFRQRSASDTTLSTLHRRRLNADCRGQHLSIDDLLEMDEEEHENLVKIRLNNTEYLCGSEKEETNKKRPWKLKFRSLKKAESAVTDTNSQKMQSAERNSARRRLSQMFRRKKTLPV
uniref:Si:dkey-106l3.7 n=2 Tax=Gasterosteus aculeatus TaxID=69293 RepID=G3PYX6_GASAC